MKDGRNLKNSKMEDWKEVLFLIAAFVRVTISKDGVTIKIGK